MRACDSVNKLSVITVTFGLISSPSIENKRTKIVWMMLREKSVRVPARTNAVIFYVQGNAYGSKQENVLR